MWRYILVCNVEMSPSIDTYPSVYYEDISKSVDAENVEISLSAKYSACPTQRRTS